MPDAIKPASAPRRFNFAINFVIILSGFALLVLLSLPVLLSFDLWIFEDRASFLHLDELVARHYHLGVDIFYSYGLLPVLLQHLLFLAFGTTFRPMIGATLAVMVVSAIFWAALLEHLPSQRRWLIGIVALSQIVLMVNPNWPYSLAVLCMMYAFLFVLKDRLDIALSVSAAGCLCVPSLTLVLTALIGLLIVLNWLLDPARRFRRLVTLFAPGALTYTALAVLLGSVFSYPSLLATAIPLAGARFYKEKGYGGVAAFLTFLHPEGYGLKYYIAYYTGSPVTWFVLCSLFLFALSLSRVPPILKGIRLTPPENFLVLSSIVQFVFIFFVYGSRAQHSIYEGVLASATLIGIGTLPATRFRNIALAVFVAVGALGESGTAYKTLIAWRTTVRSPETFGLYADPGFTKDLAQIVELSQSHRTLMLGYATGAHTYYPTLEDPDAWTLQAGQVFPNQVQALVQQIKQADLVVEVLTSPSALVSDDPDIQAELSKMHMIHPNKSFRILQR